MADIPLADPDIGPAAFDRVETLLSRGELADGPEVRQFEDEFADFCDVSHGVATSNGTTALCATLRAFGVERGDAVVTSPFSFVASANAVRLAGGQPVFADIDPETYTLDPDAVRRCCDERDDVVGILPVHLYGCPAPMDELTTIADEYDLFVVEDACQAHGASLNGEPVGSLGDAACFSFYPTKNMTTGEGGMVTTDSTAVADRIARYCNHGRATGDRAYGHVELGHNFRMTSIAAAIGRRQLDRLPALNDARRSHAAYYDEHLPRGPIERPIEPAGARHVYHQYTIRTPDRDALAESLAAEGIDTGVYYDTPIHEQPAYDDVHTAAGTFPQTELAADEVLSIPVHPSLDDDARRAVVSAIATHFEER
ncbi:putative PLP-dependent enzyme possibly involved in cell wall biogenesis [Halovivax ruber XH-70]|uniref:Putative PLP-dependent enzyme possibly involved in cell wall biogenesis n=1 Tax=Halovivax ruber (strain DSM 18193 / JCM 13892 / XH-70) TaxID=797302 RepID=L0I9C4_HALRX|nr:DegT/DnrJ/EryC1/StrS family aminotransferase [Halovivax ruber]AGB16215.1 putative PLP-dependent enzyme possibly involved in cell wall biogenesis [Halovivax ruber XH-70]